MNGDAGRILVEVCVGSMADVEAAVSAGAERVELCGGLELGGLTPSWGLAECVLAASTVPVIVMLRPRAGGFCYDRHEFAALLRDGEQMLEFGASGLAFGILDAEGNIDESRSREVAQLAGPRESVFHRAFDFVANQIRALDLLADIGCTRLLTSGGQPTASAGVDRIGALVQHSGNRIEVMAGGGIKQDTVCELVRRSGCRQVHLGAAVPALDNSIGGVTRLNLCDDRFLRDAGHRVVSGEAIAETVAALRNGCSS